MHERLRITVSGRVQGVGFRPRVKQIADRLGLQGFVRNVGAAVEIEVEGQRPARLLDALRASPPPAATMNSVTCASLPADNLTAGASRGFHILPSTTTADGATAGSQPQPLPDQVCCADCLADIEDPDSRFFGYAFTSCSVCGPRYSIQTAMPWDRERTTMAAFPPCARCRAEHDDPADRRFHAQTIACPDCGPRLRLLLADGMTTAVDRDAVAEAARLIARGGILALQGIGGFQLLADARNELTIATLRNRKARPGKPFAVMFADLAGAGCHCRVSADEADLLTSPIGPIVLLRRQPATGDGAELEPAGTPLPGLLAPALETLGVMLPSTPLHHLLFRALRDLAHAERTPAIDALVCTSGNRGGEPIAIDPTTARTRLAGLADSWLVHDRKILRPLDDPVARVIDGAPQWLRLGRGVVPLILPMEAPSLPVTLACGGSLKNTIALAGSGQVIVSQHLGDLDNADCLDAQLDTARDLATLFDRRPLARVIDAHPDCIAAQAGPGQGLPTQSVPHHLAHAMAGLLEHAPDDPILAIVWDGSGFGTDGSIWGSESFVIRRGETGFIWRRAVHLRPFLLPGGDAAAREPRRALAGLEMTMAEAPAHPATAVNRPITTSMGRLFDAVAALAGFTTRQTWEGEAASKLEHAASGQPGEPCPFPLRGRQLDWEPLLRALQADRASGATAAGISARFHATLATAIVTVARHEACATVLLTGGCFQNALLTQAACDGLRAAGYTPLLARRLPPNDSGIAAGQSLAAAAGLRQVAATEPKPIVEPDIPCASPFPERS